MDLIERVVVVKWSKSVIRGYSHSEDEDWEMTDYLMSYIDIASPTGRIIIWL